jgi:O-antigen ligase
MRDERLVEVAKVAGWVSLAAATTLVALSLGILASITLIFLTVIAAALVRYPELSLYVPLFSFAIEYNFYLNSLVKIEIHTLFSAVCIPWLIKIARKGNIKLTAAKLVGLALLILLPSLPHLTDPSTLITVVKWLTTVAYGLAVFTAGRDAVTARRLIDSYLVVSLVIVAAGLIQNAGFTNIWISKSYVLGLPDSTLGYYSNFAAFAACAFIVSTGMLINTKPEFGLRFMLHVSCALLSGLAVTISQSRGAFVVLVTGLVVLLILSLRSAKKVLSLFSFGALFALTAVIAIPSSTIDQFINRFLVSQGGDVVRRQLQDAGFSILATNPLGIGLFQFPKFIAQNGLLAERDLSHSHNTFVQLGLDFGWVGLSLFLGFLATGVALLALRKVTAISSVASAGILGGVIQGTQDYMFYELPNLLVFGLLVGLFWSGTSTAKRKTQQILAISGRQT